MIKDLNFSLSKDSTELVLMALSKLKESANNLMIEIQTEANKQIETQPPIN